MFLRWYVAIACASAWTVGPSHGAMSSPVSCVNVARAPHAAACTCLLWSTTRRNIPPRMLFMNPMPCSAVGGGGSPGRGAKVIWTTHRANRLKVQHAMLRTIGLASSRLGTKNPMSCGTYCARPPLHPSATAPSARMADSRKRQFASASLCSTTGRIIGRRSSPKRLDMTSKPLALLLRRFHCAASSSSSSSYVSSSPVCPGSPPAGSPRPLPLSF
mmetsp:Transcript_10719/g.49322  ORF Transcript_10719/g.49322 Transcript_10719/m.49322 type:complete len:216 (-) Transcript_10719:1082-1729(-)